MVLEEGGNERGGEVVKTEEVRYQEPERHPEFPTEPTTDEELRKMSGGMPFSTFLAYPTGIHFSGELPNEDVVLLIRAHPITNVPWILLAIIAGLLPFIVLPFGVFLEVIPPGGSGFTIILLLLWYMGIFTYSLLQILYWYFNVGIVTNERVVDIDWNNITHQDIASTQMSKIQDIRGAPIGVLASFFDFGNVYVQTAGTEPNIEFLYAPHPRLIVRKIEELMQQEELEHEVNPQE